LKIEIYSKKNCHLCEVMFNTVNESILELNTGYDFNIEVIDIETKAELQKYKLKIPVLMIDGKMFAKYELDKDKLKKKLKSRKF